ncbi:DDE-type integrase/transposase/recombinase [Paenibacillus sediminis]|uniref:Integrase catalytic domain-containing protein n=1 Tax=Paenibacillus sediminis TaxID=664909 RepID=A0ABS4H446_9BACL|nr:DDE-type integrase/transposase/recombinase [Paenibacillus sediminis]MBP1937305.1 hypothetical protein [Paenibacillus sediminis]
MQTEIYRNSILEVWPDLAEAKELEVIEPQLLRVLWMSNKTLVTIDIRDKKAQPEIQSREIVEHEIQEGNIQITEYFIPRIQLPDEKLKPKDIEIRNKVWGYIEPIISGENTKDIFNKRLRGIIINDISDRLNISRTSIRINLRKFWQRGMTENALLPDYPNSGARGEKRSGLGKKLGRPNQEGKMDPDLVGVNVTEEMKRDKFRPAIQRWYNKRDKKTLYGVYELMLGAYFKAGIDAVEGIILKPEHERPTFRQFYYWYRTERDIKKEYKGRNGQRKVNLKYREIDGTFDGQSFGPGSLYQIDATIGNLYLVNRKNRNFLIGRPVIYFVVDVFSRLIAGLYVGLEGPSWIGAALALENAASDKVEYCKRFNIDITPEEWPSIGLPERLTTDRGEYVGNKPSHLIKTLNVKIEHLPAYRPDWKPFVEKQFDVSNETYIRWVPGAILERMRERGEQGPIMEDLLDIHEFETILIEYVRYHNQHYLTSYKRNDAMIADDVAPTPSDLWHWGRKNSLGTLRSTNKEELWINLLPSRKGRFTASGIKFNKEIYTCNTAEEESWRFKARNGERINVEYSFDPRNTSKLYLRHEDGSIEECYRLTEQHTKFISRSVEVRWEEQLDIAAYEARMAKKGKSDNTESKLNLINKVTQQVKNAKASTSDSEVQQTDVKLNRNSALQEERDRRRRKFEDSTDKPQQAKNVVPLKRKDSGSYIPPIDHSDLLRQVLEEED